MSDVIGSDSYKTVLSVQAMNNFAKQEGVVLVHSPLLYRLYNLYIEGKAETEDRPTFFRKVGQYLYYERFTCEHGDEYYYYIKFNEDSDFYKEHKELIKLQILASDPSLLSDYNGKRVIKNYNNFLKENE